MYLNCHSYFSFKYGTMSISELIEQAVANNISTLALTDINNTSAGLEFVRQCELHNIKPILGIDFRNGAEQQFVGIAKNNAGYRELNEFLTDRNTSKTEIPSKAPAFENCYVIYPEGRINPLDLEANEFIGIRPEALAQLALKQQLYPKEKLVILHPITFRNKVDFNTHRLLRAIDNNLPLSKLPDVEVADEEEMMLPTAEVLKRYWDYPNLIENTRKLLVDCSIKFEFGKSKNKKVFSSSGANDQSLLRQLAYEGFKYRYPDESTEAQERLEKELKVISSMDFCAYFLINWDIVRYARTKGY
jgi:DNA polymerase-3 subunit alpha